MVGENFLKKGCCNIGRQEVKEKVVNLNPHLQDIKVINFNPFASFDSVLVGGNKENNEIK